MRIARFVVDSDPLYGIVEGEPGSEMVTVINGDPFFQGVERTAARHKLEDVRLLAPIIPRSKVIGVGRNFVEHAKELGNDVPAQPLLFLKPNTSVIGPNDPIILPEFSEEVSFEAELCVVIDRICNEVPEERVHDVVFGHTCGNAPRVVASHSTRPCSITCFVASAVTLRRWPPCSIALAQRSAQAAARSVSAR